MWIFRIPTRCTSTYKLAFRSIIYVWNYPFVIYNHQAGRRNMKIPFCKIHIHILKQFYTLFLFVCFTFVDNISSFWMTSFTQPLQCKVMIQTGLFLGRARRRESRERGRERESWWDQSSKWLWLKTVTEIKKTAIPITWWTTGRRLPEEERRKTGL